MKIDFTSVANVLGLSSAKSAPDTPFGLMRRIEDGIPLRSLDHVVHFLAPGDAQFKYRFVPKATYGRRKVEKRLSSDEGSRLARVARVWSLALDVWGSESEARDFLFRSHSMLEDALPIDLAIKSEIGAEMVLDILLGLKYGSAA